MALNSHLDLLLDEAGRSRKAVKRSMMTALFFSETQAGLDELLGKNQAGELWGRGVLVGCAAEVLDQIHALSQAGVERVIIQWPDLKNFDLLESFSKQVLSRVETI
jgi:alkanesulfonate monooxygenase SsuD/methylene tetrahydromethanopterin reductase-like flavin-dependent oxidoreductase (luciferase family)